MASEQVWWFAGLNVENVGSVVAFIALEPGRQVGSPGNPSRVERTVGNVGMWVCGGGYIDGGLACAKILRYFIPKKQGLHFC